jgi:hypothetical protein
MVRSPSIPVPGRAAHLASGLAVTAGARWVGGWLSLLEFDEFAALQNVDGGYCRG